MFQKVTHYLETAKMQKKISITINIIIVMFLIAMTVAISGLVTGNNNMVYFYRTPYVNSTLQMEIQMNMQEVGKDVLWVINTTDLNQIKERAATARESAANFAKNMDELYQNFENKELLEQLGKEVAVLAQAREQILELALANKNEEALELFGNEYEPAMEKVEEILVGVGAAADEDAESSYQDTLSSAIIVFALTIIVTILAIVAGRQMTTRITKIIVAPIDELKDAADSIAKGNLEIDVTYKGTDELGELAESFRQTCSTLKLIIGDLQYLLGELKEGNFCVKSNCRDAYVGDFATIFNDLRDMIYHQSDVLTDIQAASNQVAMGSNQLSENAQSLAEGATDQAGAVQELTATITNVTLSAEQTAEVALKAYKEADVYIEQAAKGTQEMEELTVAMEKIDMASREIENIIGQIEDIASQTNLLSLNASIEAARAGEAGRGFAVVADQIGKLASDSGSSAVNTRELIMRCLEDVKNGNEATARTKETLHTVIEGIEKLAKASRQSSDNASVQLETMQEIERGIEQISNVVQSNSASAQETSATSEELSAQAFTLNQLVAQFKLVKER